MKKQTASTRVPFTDKELWYATSDQFLTLTEEQKVRLQRINKEKEQERIQSSARLRVEEEPILAELCAMGWDMESVWTLVNTSTRYAEAVPILLKHLRLPYSDRTREGIARALAVPEPEVQKAWPTLVAEYRQAGGLGH